MALRRDGARKLLYASGYAHALARAKADLRVMLFEHQREMAELNAQLVQLRREVDELRAVAGLRDPTTKVH
jgi:hypothetical protein